MPYTNNRSPNGDCICMITGLPLLKSGLGENQAEGAIWPVRCYLLNNSSGHGGMKIQCVAFRQPKKEES